MKRPLPAYIENKKDRIYDLGQYFFCDLSTYFHFAVLQRNNAGTFCPLKLRFCPLPMTYPLEEGLYEKTAHFHRMRRPFHPVNRSQCFDCSGSCEMRTYGRGEWIIKL